MLFSSATMSLDGYIAGVGGDMSWLSRFVTGAPDPVADALMARSGSLLIGNRTFGGDDPNAGTDAEGAFGGQWSGVSVVLTHHPKTDTPDVRYVGDLTTAVETARTAAGDRDVNILGADVARQCLQAGLLEEIWVSVAPILLGDGVPLFRLAGGTRVDLQPIAVTTEPMPWFGYRVVR
ncbi:dihydrofolate reductase family protein [Nakamurella leprariae]|uniref:Dihydrofolate reductase family protein n=1 Tax=Nakamurella leprariae TaxID=2803911 RepID=A0A939C0Q3_9ACTN|nr:dihydrofolate reductase family protein [Nakamurella leprariae]MBM9469016.1 dihydrofolate reductase family protein [Nakamurella leprariae]